MLELFWIARIGDLAETVEQDRKHRAYDLLQPGYSRLSTNLFFSPRRIR